MFLWISKGFTQSHPAAQKYQGTICMQHKGQGMATKVKSNLLRPEFQLLKNKNEPKFMLTSIDLAVEKCCYFFAKQAAFFSGALLVTLMN